MELQPPLNPDEARLMNAQVHLAPVFAELATGLEEPELIPPVGSVRELHLSAYTGFIAYDFPPGTIIHQGILRLLAQQLRSRRPMVAIADDVVHVQFALEDDSDASEARVQYVAERLGLLVPNGSLAQASICYYPSTLPHRP